MEYLQAIGFKLSWLMVWFVIIWRGTKPETSTLFQTKLTYGMICYATLTYKALWHIPAFQTKLTYGMICYVKALFFKKL